MFPIHADREIAVANLHGLAQLAAAERRRLIKEGAAQTDPGDRSPLSARRLSATLAGLLRLPRRSPAGARGASILGSPAQTA